MCELVSVNKQGRSVKRRSFIQEVITNMSKISFSAIITAAAFLSACGGGTSTSNLAANANAKGSTAANQSAPANAQPASTPAVTQSPAPTPANSSVPPANASSSANAERPRVVDTKKQGKSATPSNAIPSDDEMRKAFSKPVTQDDVNDPGMRKSEPMMMKRKEADQPMMKAKPADVPMMRSNKKPDKP